MIKFILPNFFNYEKENNAIIFLSNNFSNYFKYPVKFLIANGNFPFAISTGHYNPNIKKLTSSYHDIEKIYNNYLNIGLNLELDFSNLTLKKEELEDNYLDLILEKCHNGGTIIEINNPDIMDYIQKKYPYYSYSLNNLTFLNKIDKINNLLEQNENILFYNLIINNFNEEEIKKIKLKNKICLNINSNYCFKCNDFINCLLLEHNKIKNYSEQSIILSCPNNNFNLFNNNNIISIEEIKNKYLKIGFTLYKINDIYFNNSKDLLYFYLKYFIKTEHIIDSILILKENNIYDC